MKKLSLASIDKLNEEVVLANSIGLFIISFTLLIAFYYQLVFSELPCPLCLLQRIGLIIVGLGFLFNIQTKIKSAHYGIVILGCLVTGIIATRQMFLHIMPGDLGYGSTFLNLHFYVWTVITAIIILVFTTLLLSINIPKKHNYVLSPLSKKIKFLSTFLFVALIVANLTSTLLECGAGQCADNPVGYDLLHLFSK